MADTKISELTAAVSIADADLIPIVQGGVTKYGTGTMMRANSQPVDADLTALAALSTTGMMARTAANTYIMRTLGAGTGIAVTNGDGAAAAPSIAIDTAVVAQLGAAAVHTENVSLSGAQAWVGTQTLTDGATIDWDMDASNVAKVTLADNRTMAAPTNLKDGGTYVLHVIQDGTGSRTITWNAVFKWPGGSAPTLTTTASARDMLSFSSDGTNLYGTATLDVR